MMFVLQSKFTNITLSRTERSDNLKKDAILGKPLINGKACTVEDIRVAEWANKSVKKVLIFYLAICVLVSFRKYPTVRSSSLSNLICNLHIICIMI